MSAKNLNYSKIFLIIAAILIFIFLPNFISGYYVRLLTSIFMYAVISQGFNLMSGYMGYLPFGNVMFFGIGAYMTAILMGKGMPFLVAVLIAAIVAVTVSIILGFPILRLRGHYFAVATIGMNGALMAIVQNTTDITGGAMGTTFPIITAPPGVVYNYFYLAMLALMVITTFIMYFIVNSKFGYAVRSIKANEEAANSMGITTTYTKVTAWAITAFFASIAGAIYGYWMSFISPNEVFDIMISVNTIVMMLIGGAGTILGPVIGAFVIETVSEFTWSYVMEYHLAALGIATIIIVFFVPSGIVGTIANFFKGNKVEVNKKVGVSSD